MDEELKGTKHGYPEALSEGNLEEADIIGDIHKRSGEALWLLRIDYEVPVQTISVDEELKGVRHGYLEALSEGNREEADVIGNIQQAEWRGALVVAD